MRIPIGDYDRHHFFRDLCKGKIPSINVGTATRPQYVIPPAEFRRWLNDQNGGGAK